jgi:tetratricopeptide (TPR) repeat protein
MKTTTTTIIIFMLLWSCSNQKTYQKQFEKAVNYENYKQDSSILIYKQISQNSSEDSLVSKSLLRLGKLYHQKGKNDSALIFLSKSLSKDKLSQIDRLELFQNRGYSHTAKSEYKEALEAHLEELELAKKMNDLSLYGKSLSAVSWIFFLSKEYDKSKQYTDKVLDIGKKLIDSTLMYQAYSRYATIYGQKEDYKSAIEFFTKARNYADRKGAQKDYARANGNLSMCYMYTGRLQEALQINKQLLELFKGKSIETNIRIIRNLGYINFQMKKYDSANYYLRKAENLCDSNNISYMKGDIITSQIEMEESRGNYKKALALHQKYVEFMDKLAVRDKAVEIEELRMKFKEDKRVIQLRAKEKRVRLIFISIFTVIVLSLSLLILIIRKNLMVNRKNLEILKLKKNSLDKELQHKKGQIFDFSQRLNEKNRILFDLEQELHLLKKMEGSSNEIVKINQSLKSHLLSENSVELIEKKIESVNQEFFEIIKHKHSDVNSDELHLIGMLRLKFSSKQIADILATTERAIEQKRYRLRKKLNLSKGENLSEYLKEFEN